MDRDVNACSSRSFHESTTFSSEGATILYVHHDRSVFQSVWTSPCSIGCAFNQDRSYGAFEHAGCKKEFRAQTTQPS